MQILVLKVLGVSIVLNNVTVTTLQLVTTKLAAVNVLQVMLAISVRMNVHLAPMV